MANNTVNDAGVVYGSLPVTIGGQFYDTDDFSIDPEITRFLRTSSNNIPTGKVVIQGEFTGSCTLQYASSAVLSPAFGGSFTVTVEGTVLNCTVEKIGKKRVKAGEAKIPITFSVNIGAVVVSTAT